MNQTPAILYVEDDRLSRKVMLLLLKDRMHLPNVTIFENSLKFRAQLEALDPKPDIVFLDIHVTPLNGFEMLAILRELPWAANIPIIALTASVMNEEVQAMKAAGFTGCLAKPIDMATFPEILRRILAGEAVWRILALQRG